ncbi:MAG: ABC transporter permease [Solirubrobacteraceae bacterium]
MSSGASPSDSVLSPAGNSAVAPAGSSLAGGRTGGPSVARLLLRSKTFVVGAVIVGWWIVDAVLWRAIVPHNPQASAFLPSIGPNSTNWFGTDDLGRDMFSRVLAGASSVLTVAPLATLLGVSGGTVIALVSVYYRGVVDDVLMRLVDAFLAFPLVILAVLVLSTFGPSTLNVILVIGIVFMPLVARTVRSAALGQRDSEYVAAARLQGDGPLWIMFVEILPNITGAILVEATIRFGYAIFTSATLSFLGLGIQQPSPDWGLTISLARASMAIEPWVVVAPAIALATLVVGVNLLADGLRHVLEEA